MQFKLLITMISLLIRPSLSVNSTEFQLEREKEADKVFVLPTSSGDEAEDAILPDKTANEVRILRAAEEVRTFFGTNPSLSAMVLGFFTGVVTVILVFLLRAWYCKRRFRAKMQIAKMKDDLYETTIYSQNFGGKTILQEV